MESNIGQDSGFHWKNGSSTMQFCSALRHTLDLCNHAIFFQL